MIALMLCGLALANPYALRVPGDGLAVLVGAPVLSAGAWIRPQAGAAVTVRGFGSVQLDGVVRTDLRDAGWTTELQLASGLVVPTLSPGVGASASVALRQRQDWDRVGLSFSAVVPVSALALPEGDLRVAPTLESSLTVRLQGVHVGVFAGVGALIGAPPRADGQLGLVLSVPWARSPAPADPGGR